MNNTRTIKVSLRRSITYFRVEVTSVKGFLNLNFMQETFYPSYPKKYTNIFYQQKKVGWLNPSYTIEIASDNYRIYPATIKGTNFNIYEKRINER